MWLNLTEFSTLLEVIKEFQFMLLGNIFDDAGARSNNDMGFQIIKQEISVSAIKCHLCPNNYLLPIYYTSTS